MTLFLLSVLIATVTADVRLTRYPRGTLQVKVGNSWHEVCGHWFWDNQNGASNACKEMGYPRGGRWHRVAGRLSNAIYIGQCVGSEVPGRGCTGACGGHCSKCRNRVNCGDCNRGSGAKIEVECYGQRTLPPTPRPTQRPTMAPTMAPTGRPTTAPTPAPTASPTSSPTEEASYGNVIEWLRELIAEGKAEIVTVKKKTQDLKDILSDAEDSLDEAQRKEGQAAAAARAAATALANAQGVWRVCTAKFATETKRLDEELRIFGKVKDILQGLLNGKQLVEQDKADVSAFISLDEEANPDTVNQIIALIAGLVEAAQDEIRKITAERNDCWTRLKAAETKNARAAGVWNAAKQAVDAAKARKNTAEAAYKAHKKYDDERTAVLNGEIAQFEEIINILQPLFE